MEVGFLQIAFWLFIIEQIRMVRLGSYPYTIGVPIAQREIPKNLESTSIGGFRILGRIKVKKDEKGDIFIRHMHFPLTWGPYVLAGHAKSDNPTELIFWIGPLTSIFFLTYIIGGLFEGIFYAFFAAVVVFSFIIYFYYSLTIGCQRMDADDKNDNNSLENGVNR